MLRIKLCQGVKCVDKKSEFGCKVFQGAKLSIEQSLYIYLLESQRHSRINKKITFNCENIFHLNFHTL